MNNPPEILAWVNCYGAWDPDLRLPVETIGYDQYLEAIAEALPPLKNRITAIYLSGGMLDQKSRTECQTIAPELTRRLAAKGFTEPKIFADEDSVTSMSIIRKFLTTWQAEYADCLPILFCDQVRYPTNAFVLEYFAGKLSLNLPPTNQILIPIPRLDAHPNSTPEKQAEKLKLMQEKGVEAVEKAEIEQRQVAPS